MAHLRVSSSTEILPMNLTSLTLSEAANLIASRELSPLELTRAHLERIEKIDPQLNCFITLTAEAALMRAREAARCTAFPSRSKTCTTRKVCAQPQARSSSPSACPRRTAPSSKS